ncbi:response regulator [Clostridium massiliamazoniense]|uniref:response regulator n=1 Tax=Clostridium massiliamazoniense TaxID=1347366 RepID=UPI0006D852F7|nr:response regulator transcription factor [Clostridium massiliamazoniense]
MINIILVDDQLIIREGIKMLLSLDDDIKIVGEGENGQDAINLTKNLNPDVILIDIRMPIMDGVEAIKKIKEFNSEVKILVLTTFNDNDYIFNSLANGANGYLLKDSNSDELISAIKTVYKGNLLIQSDVAMKMSELLKSNPAPQEKTIDLSVLTPRELEVTKLVAKGYNNKKISTELFLSEGTVKNYVSRILDKLQLENRTDLAINIKF